jgi:hypothetical protein
MKKNLILFAFLFVTTVSLFAQYTFKHIPIGGGGFVTGVISHKTTGDIYCRTDVGGAYRWDAANNKWVQLLDWFSEAESGFGGVEALAIDNQNPNNIYMLCGTSYVNGGRSAILKSTDKGNTFTYVDVTSKFKAHGNGYGRGNGERLAVDPNNSNILFCGTRDNGLWKSTDGGINWALAWNGVTTTTNGNGICFVLFDPSSASGGVTQTVYIGVSRMGSDNIYKSTDGGVTFTPMSATTTYMPHRAALKDTTMYVTYADNEGPGSNGKGAVYKLNTSTGVWKDITPYTFNAYYLSYGGVDIDPADVNRVVISTTGIYMNNQYGKTWGDFVYLSTNGGTSWTLKNGNSCTFDNNGIGCASGQDNWAECAVFDPFDSKKVRVVGGGGIFTTSDITATNPTWYYDVIGIEETAFLDGVSVPGGPFICAMGDMTGFLFTDLTAYPAQFLKPGSGTNRSVAYASANVNKLVRTSDADAHVYYSTNMGANWTACTTSKGSGGQATLSADGGTILHCPSDTLYYSTNNGTTWTKSTGAIVSGAIPMADQVNSNYFYVYNPGDGKMYYSSNKGVSFSIAGTPGSSSNPWTTNRCRTVPDNEGHIWVPRIANGLKYSTDYGKTYKTITNVSYCRSIGFGKAAPGAQYPTIFIWGTVNGITGLFRSTDKGTTWLRMNDNTHQFGGLELLVGDMNVFGRLYTGGGGIIYWEDQSISIKASKNPVCQGESNIAFSIPKIQGARYKWTYSGTGATINNDTLNAISINFSNTATSGTLTVNAKYPADSTWTLDVIVGIPLAQPSIITTEKDPVCKGDNNITYSVTNDPTLAYNWTYSGTGATISNGNTNAISVNYGSASTGGILTVTASKDGCSNSRAATVTVNSLPAQPTVISASKGSVCVGANGITYSVTKDAAVTYNWTYSGTGATLSNATTNTISASYSNSATSGTLKVTATNSGGCSSSRTLAVIVNVPPAQPSVITARKNPVCQGEIGATYSVINDPAVTYTWTYSGTGASIFNGNTNSASINFSKTATSGDLKVTVANTTGCVDANTNNRILAVTINSLPTPAIVASKEPVIQGDKGITYSVTNDASATYNWTYSGTGTSIANNTTSTASVDFSSSATDGNMSVTVTNAGGCTNSGVLPVTVNSNPNGINNISADGLFTVIFNSGKSEALITYHLTTAASVKIELFNMQGKLIKRLEDSYKSPGYYDVRASTNGLAKGLYIIRYSAGATNLQKKVLVIE